MKRSAMRRQPRRWFIGMVYSRSVLPLDSPVSWNVKWGRIVTCSGCPSRLGQACLHLTDDYFIGHRLNLSSLLSPIILAVVVPINMKIADQRPVFKRQA